MEPESIKPFQHRSLDIFKMAMTEPLPWNTQRDMATQIMKSLEFVDGAELAQFNLQLAVMYHIGYGLEFNDNLALKHLHEAYKENIISDTLFIPVSRALATQNEASSHSPLADDQERLSKSNQYLPQRPIHGNMMNMRPSPVIQEPEILQRCREGLEELSIREPYDQKALLFNLTTAYQRGDFDTAISLASSCLDFSNEIETPNPLHWLVNFNHPQVEALLSIMSRNGHGESPNNLREPLAQSSGPPLYIPHLCMQLIGTPLHWAVRTGNVELVSILISYGADINLRWQSRAPLSSEPPLGKYQPSFSPLDVSVAYHLSEIADILLSHGSETFGGDRDWDYSVFHMMGLQTIPFSRLVLHGECHRTAISNTIRVLQDHNIDINSTDSEGDTPLTLAVSSFSIEPYIFEELLAAGARTSEEFDTKHGSVIIKDAKFSGYFPISGWRTKLLLPLVGDLNMLDPEGHNALHYCAWLDATATAKVLLDTGRINVNKKSKFGYTALACAAIRGSTAIIDCLAKAGADLDLQSSSGSTALELAVNGRHAWTAIALIKAGASISYAKHNVLHLAVTTVSQRGSIVSTLLEHCREELGTSSILNGSDSSGWTAMHYAAYFGDYDGVKALLDAKADPFAYKYRALYSLKETPFDLVSKTIEKFKTSGDLGLDHAAVKKKGKQAVNQFLNRMDSIQAMLSDYTQQ
ncbi:ankyrin repeat-containing domain protein [Biscogniauxia marginata]|nr:ankyrin repeat-containing domain protein [Biscogniauxia marginata]